MIQCLHRCCTDVFDEQSPGCGVRAKGLLDGAPRAKTGVPVMQKRGRPHATTDRPQAITGQTTQDVSCLEFAQLQYLCKACPHLPTRQSLPLTALETAFNFRHQAWTHPSSTFTPKTHVLSTMEMPMSGVRSFHFPEVFWAGRWRLHGMSTLNPEPELFKILPTAAGAPQWLVA